jgi:hypothetical protein
MAISASTLPQTSRNLHVARRLILAVIAALVLAWAVWWGLQRVMWWTPTGHDIAHVVRGAVAVNETLLTPPEAYRNVPITSTKMAALSRTAQSKLASYYVGEPLTNWRDTARQTLNPRDLHWGKTAAWMTQWRVDWIHLGELSLLPGSETARATSSAEFRSNGGAINRLDYAYHLVYSRSGWRIDREEWAFQPGYGP